MFKKSNQQEVPQRRKMTLTPLEKAPSMDDVKQIFTETSAARGNMIEVQIRLGAPPIYLLTCEFPATVPDPIWSLYEGEDGSKVMWSCPNNNLEMVYEMLIMSLPGAAPTPKSDSLKELALPPQPVTPPGQPGAPAHGGGFGTPSTSFPAYGQPQQQQPYPQQQQPYPQQQQPYPQQQQPYPQQQQPYPQQQQPYPQQQQPYPQQQQPYPQQYPQQQQQPAFNAPYGAPALPQGYPQPNQGNPFPGQQPPQQQQAWGAPATNNPFPQSTPPHAFPNYTPAGSFPAHAAGQPGAEGTRPADLTGFVDLLSKGHHGNMLIGHLFVEAGVLPEPLLEAALKIQELVRQGALSNTAGIEAMKQVTERGGLLTDDIINHCRALHPTDPPAQVQGGAPGELDGREAARQVIMLLHQAGVVTENDVSTAEGVRRKHGGDVGNILVAAGKIEKVTLDAARRCQPLVREHRLNPDEAFRILQHCQKTKVTIEDACRDLAIRPM